ncbi:MAG: hypothetical protein WB998_12530 [Solirubrobacteraceae bacterium]
MSLSICCVTTNPSRAAGAVAPFRELAGEIVVAVDISGGELDLTPLGRLADQLFEIELDTFPEPAMAWLHAQCGGDWILRIDDDELPDAGLLERLPELTRAGDVVQYWLARRWLYPDSRHWLRQWPWFPDFQGRLVRNDAQLWFPGLCHSSVALTLPARYLDEGIYHLVNLQSDRGERERKIARYLEVNEALRVTAADSQLTTYYLPEDSPGARTAAVDSRDHGAIDVALLQPGEGSSLQEPPLGQAPRARRVAHTELHARWAARTFADSGYEATIRPLDVHRRLIAGDHRPFRVLVINEGSEWWPGGENRDPLIRVAYKWLTPDGDVVEAEGHRTPLSHPLAPEESCVVMMNVTPPSMPGRYLFVPDLVHEHFRWFGCQAEPIEMVVTPDERAVR